MLLFYDRREGGETSSVRVPSHVPSSGGYDGIGRKLKVYSVLGGIAEKVSGIGSCSRGCGAAQVLAAVEPIPGRYCKSEVD